MIHCQLVPCISYMFSWKNEFHHWLHDLEPKINVYLFTNDDVRIGGREQFLRQVSRKQSIVYEQRVHRRFFSGMKMVVFS